MLKRKIVKDLILRGKKIKAQTLKLKVIFSVLFVELPMKMLLKMSF